MCHRADATLAEASAVSTLAVFVIQSPQLTALMTGTGGAELLSADAAATLRSTVALAAITMRANEEWGLAIWRATPQFEQDDRFCTTGIWHAPAKQALDNSKPFLSP